MTVLTLKFDHQLEELKALHLKELADRDGKIKLMKMQMADALKDNSRWIVAYHNKIIHSQYGQLIIPDSLFCPSWGKKALT